MRKHNIKNKPLKITLIAILLSIILLLLTGFILRNTILKNVIDNKKTAIEQRYKIAITYTNAAFSGISTINLHNLSVVPENSDTLLHVDTLSVSIRPLDIILQRIRLSELVLNGTLINLQRQGLKSNYLFLLKSSENSVQDTITRDHEADYGNRISVILDAVFDRIPASATITNFLIKAQIDSNNFSFVMPELLILNNNFHTKVFVKETNMINAWLVNGHLDRLNRDFNLSVKSSDTTKVVIPYISKRWNTVFAFDSAAISLSYNKNLNNETHLSGKAVLTSPLLNHPRISPDNIELNNSEIDFSISIGKSFLEVDSTTWVSFNQTGFRPYIRYTLYPEKEIALKINEPRFNAQDFFNSLPGGLFSNLQGIKVHGDLSFFLDFKLNLNNPDSLYFSSQLKGIDFAIEQFGNTNFTYINHPFVYTAYENGQPVRQISVSDENPEFRRIDQIPEHLKHAIMTSEDGSFYYHNGFIPDAIKYSMITNIKEKRFARGGSTISMQLVKNVFLNRNKNITRKLEEMLITWLIESKRLVTKDRMFEVYLNIIETGPMIYGVNEAAKFYFRKEVSKLTLAESIYIASIIPRPKLYRYSFDKEGNLREYLTSYYNLVSGKMLNRGWITQEEFDNLKPEVELTGPARSTIVTDTIPPDEEKIIERKGFFQLFNFDFLKKKEEDKSK